MESRPVFEIYSDSVINQSQTFSGLVGAIWQVNDKLSFDAAVRYASVDGRPVSELRLGMTFGFPLILNQPALIGVVATHFVNVHEPTPIELSTVHSYGEVAADHLRQLLAGEALKDKALSMSERLYLQAALGSYPHRPPYRHSFCNDACTEFSVVRKNSS